MLFRSSLFDSARGWITAGSLIAAFVLGVTLAARMRRAGAHHGPLHVLLAVAALLSAAALLGLNGWVWPAALCMAVAMGAENIVFERDGEVVVGVTYMTGALVKLGQRIADALGGGPRWAWTAYLQLWLGLACGAILGAFLFHQIGFHALWLPVTVALICGWMLRGEG